MSVLKPKTDIQKACLCAVKSAYNKYFKFSGGQSLWYAPESFIQAEIASFLSEVCPYVTLEDGVKGLLKVSNAKLAGRHPRAGRIDIVTWWNYNSPRKYIEIKKAFNKNALNEDAKRLRQMLGRGGTARKGIIIAYTSATKEKTIENRFKDMADNSRTKLVSNLGPQPSENNGEYWYWDAACFQV